MAIVVRLLVSIAFILIFIASQLFWVRQVRRLGERLIPREPLRRWLGGFAVIVYLFLFAYTFAWSESFPEPTQLTLRAALLQAPYRWWVICSLLGFGIAIVFWAADRVLRAAAWGYGKVAAAFAPGPRTAEQDLEAAVGPGNILVNNRAAADPPSPSRRRFLEQAAIAVSATPFVAGAYGLLYGRLNLQTTSQRIKLARLPKAFDGFRIAQLSDMHIGPFMPEEEIRNYVAITNEMKPDLVVLTGDFITWDPSTQAPVVKALSGLRAPFGVFGCLGNHEAWYEVEDSITRLFAAEGIRILRGGRVLVQSHGEALSLLGVDFQTRSPMGPPGQRVVRRYLQSIERLVVPDTANILLSHNPNSFDRAAELGIGLSLAGHTHGGQLTMEFVHPSLSPSRLITKYVKGWFQKDGSQLYVNRGIGTMFAPIRVGAPPEITVFELVRATQPT